MAGATLAIAVMAACLVNKKSNDFTCTSPADCDPGRTCESGFCIASVIDAPPSIDAPIDAPLCPVVSVSGSTIRCTSCDLVAMTCDVDCGPGTNCNSLRCPAGFACDFSCTKSNGCDDIDCSVARACVVQCTISNACQDITCGPGACDVTCATTNACGDINCASSCQCAVTCAPSANCDTMTCPTALGVPCTTTGAPGAECSPTPTPGCAMTCP